MIKAGSKVKVISNNPFHFPIGTVGEAKQVFEGSMWPYEIVFSGVEQSDDDTYPMGADEVEAAE